MRRLFAKLLQEEMKKNEDIHLITGDLGYGLWDKIRDDFPTRFHNVGSSEMVMMGMGIGLAMEGKIPYVYSITPFAIYRPFEMIRNYLDHEGIPVNIICGATPPKLTFSVCNTPIANPAATPASIAFPPASKISKAAWAAK